MQLTEVTPPALEPITLTEAKAHARIDSTAEDTLITSQIIAARRLCEQYCDRAFINQTWRVTYDIDEEPTAKSFINLPYGKVQSITSIKSYDSENVATTLDTDYYRLSGNRIVLNDNYDWPTLDRTYDAFEITYVVGFGALASDIPQDIKQAILMTVSHFFENREAFIDPMGAGTQQVMLPFGVNALLQPYKNYSI